MEKFVFRDHPTDLKVQAFGQNEAELFANAALGMMTFLYPKRVYLQNRERREQIVLRAEDIRGLLIDWLSELLNLSDANDTCYNIYDIKKINNKEISATVYGRRFRSKENIKAVTYHELMIEQIGGRWKATVRFDLKR